MNNANTRMLHFFFNFFNPSVIDVRIYIITIPDHPEVVNNAIVNDVGFTVTFLSSLLVRRLSEPFFGRYLKKKLQKFHSKFRSG